MKRNTNLDFRMELAFWDGEKDWKENGREKQDSISHKKCYCIYPGMCLGSNPKESWYVSTLYLC